ncbi:MAG: hypothetical protein V1646_04430 [bacterium]
MIEDANKKSLPIANESMKETLPANSPLSTQKTQKEIDAERLSQWEEKIKNATPCFRFKQNITEDKDGKKVTTLAAEGTRPDHPSFDLVNANYYAIYGSADMGFAAMLQAQAYNALFTNSKDNQAEMLNSINAALLSLSPKDEFEGMLCTRLIALHSHYMEFMSRASNAAQTPEGVDLNVNRATKLMRVYNETLETLNRYRRKGEQKVTVQHVNVGSGGQAVVNGQINQGGGDNEKK